MAVYTQLSEHSLKQILKAYPLGNLQHFSGVTQGVTNTNYFVTTDRGAYFLTLFEELQREQLPFFIQLTHQLAQANIPCPETMQTKSGESITLWQNKPVIIVERLAGETIGQPNIRQCQQVAQLLAKLHLASKTITLSHETTRGLLWHQTTAQRVMPKLTVAEKGIVSEELELLENAQLDCLPSGIIHADLFCDNVLFVGDDISGVIDFYYACHGPWLYDLAIGYNDWCLKQDHVVEDVYGQAFIDAYQAVRPLTVDEIDLWPICLRLASLRFWLSRLYDFHFPEQSEQINMKNPDEFKHISLFHRQRSQRSS